MVRRRHGYYLRVRVPPDLKIVLGTHLVRSLKSPERSIAQSRAVRHVASLPAFWEEMRGKMAQVLGKEINQLQASDLVGCDRARFKADFDKLNQSDLKDLMLHLSELTVQKQDEIAEEAEGVSLLRELVSHFKQAKLQGFLEGSRSAVGNIAQPVAPPEPPKPVGDARGLKPWPEFIVPFFLDNPGLAETTLVSHRQAFRELEKVIGAKAIGEVNGDDIVKFADYLRDRPSGRGGKLARTAIEKLLQHVKSLFGWAYNRKVIREDPAKGVQPRKMNIEERNSAEENAKRSFTNAEIRKIFDCPLYAGCKSPTQRLEPGNQIIRDARYYFLLTAFFTGARVSELPEARIVEDEGVTWIDLTDTATKTWRSKRRVPVLTPLKRTGFVTWARAREKAGFPMFQGTKDCRADWSQAGNRLLNDIGIDHPSVTLHSFRHTFRQMLTGSGIDLILVQRALGHKASSGNRAIGITDVYGPGLSPAEGKLIVDSFKLPIPLDHLFIE